MIGLLSGLCSFLSTCSLFSPSFTRLWRIRINADIGRMVNTNVGADARSNVTHPIPHLTSFWDMMESWKGGFCVAVVTVTIFARFLSILRLCFPILSLLTFFSSERGVLAFQKWVVMDGVLESLLICFLLSIPVLWIYFGIVCSRCIRASLRVLLDG
ncbi:uncharacterized protein BDW43DRAFT_259455 [Aspergillus alliaceus]|uniref:uncharacterized protein n=1 Tax=Petromyces alliaceus TaxID=209559 RepID=UPI0012A3DA19|nr:uncharacterized protein BDW43DRAFT_259455 [Aspergillus alliaceus]KAB8239848.1 hypothetical protein BDW43DRAFT_259455 [Aspergillus alliaceus]